MNGGSSGWPGDPVPTVDDYEVQVLTFDLMTGGQTTETRIVTDPTFFQTSFGRVGLRVRGRKLDADICSTSPGRPLPLPLDELVPGQVFSRSHHPVA